MWSIHVPVVEAFLAISSQWRTGLAAFEGAVQTIWIGFDYAGVRAGLELAGVELTPALWLKLRIMEAAAVKALNERG